MGCRREGLRELDGLTYQRMAMMLLATTPDSAATINRIVMRSAL